MTTSPRERIGASSMEVCPRLSTFDLTTIDSPAETVTDIWLEKYENHPIDERFTLAKDVIELAIRCEDTYPFSMFENQLLRELSGDEQKALIAYLSAEKSETASYMKTILETQKD